MTAQTTMENQSLTTNLSECFVHQHQHEAKQLVFFFVAVIVMSIPSNTFALFVSWQHIRQKNELGVFLFNLALADLMFALGLTLLLDIMWRGVHCTHGGRICMLCFYFMHANFYTSEALLCCIAVDRYLAVAHPFRFVNIRKVGTAAAVTATIWVLVLCFTAWIITWIDFDYEDKTFSLCMNIFPPISEPQVRASFIRFLLGFVAPAVLVFFATWGICTSVNTNQATKEAERKRISKLLALVLFSMLFCFGPIHVMMLVRTLVTECSSFQRLLTPTKISIAISSLNCLADPLLYCFVTKTGHANVNQFILFLQGKTKSKDERIT